MSVGTSPRWITMADFNLDSRMDVAVVDYVEGKLYIGLSIGSGTLFMGYPPPIAVGTHPTFALTNDFDGDGRPDVAVLNADSVAIVLVKDFYGLPSPRLASGSPLALTGTPVQMASADFNNDNKQDLAVISSEGKLTILLGNGAGGFSPATGSPIILSAGLLGIGLIDFNHDNKKDCVVTNGTTGQVIFLQGNGLGGFTSVKTIGVAQAGPLAVGDLDQDGLSEIVVGGANRSITVLKDQGNTNFTASTTSYTLDGGGRTTAVLIDDFRGDGYPLVAAADASGSAAYLVQPGFGAVWSFAASNVHSLVAGDFDGEGRTDLLTDDDVNAHVTLWSSTCNRLPVITWKDFSPIAGAPPTRYSIATVTDADSLAVSARLELADSGFIKFTNLALNYTTGEITADVQVGCPTTNMDLYYYSWRFTLIAEDYDGSLSIASKLITPAPPGGITTQPVSLLKAKGQAASFSIATGSGTFSYQWMKDGINLSDGGRLSGTKTATLNISAGQGIDVGGYAVSVTGACATTTSQTATLRLNAPPVAGRAGNLNFPALTDSYVQIAKDPVFSAFPALTVEAWVKISSAAGRYDILNKAPLFFNLQNGKPAIYIFGLSNPGYHISPTAIAVNEWTHVAASWDGSAVKVFVNGTQTYSANVTGNPTASSNPAMTLGICGACGNGAPFYGGLDEVRLWQVARSAPQLQNNRYHGLVGNEAGLEAYWRFDEAIGTTLSDAAGHGYDGILLGKVTWSNNDEVTTTEDTLYSGNLFASDPNGDALTYSLVSQGAKGTIAITNAATGVFTYTPNANANGADSFTFKVNNGATDSNIATVNVTINAVNDLPLIVAEPAITLTKGQAAVTKTLATVSDVEAGVLTVAATTLPPGVTVSNLTLANGIVTATIAADCTAAMGANAIVLTLTDADGATAAANFMVNIVAAPALAVTTQPVAQTLLAGQTATFIAAATSATNMQWQTSVNGGQFWTDVRGATNPTLSFTTNNTNNGQRYRAVVWNCASVLTTNEVALTVTPAASPRTLGIVIREFRLRGNSIQPELDEYIELFNNTNDDLTVATDDGSPGWTVLYLLKGGNSAIILTVLPTGTVIPAKSHYLIVNNSANGYSLNSVATGDDTTFTFGIDDDTGLAIFKTRAKNNFNATTVIDAVGFQQTGTLASLFREGTGLPPLGATNGEYAWVRRMENGLALDTDNNVNDFILVSPSGATINGVTSVIGAPGPENSTSPRELNRAIFSTLFDPLSAPSAMPNQVRDTPPLTNGIFGTLVLRRTFTNNTGAPLKKLRFRVIDITNAASGAEADLRVLDSVSSTINGKSVQGLTLEQPTTQTGGGGLNSTLAVGTITPAIPLAAGATVNVEFKLGVMRKGKYRFFLNIEAAP